MKKLNLTILLVFFFQLFFSSHLINAAEITAFGPTQYVRTTGAPNIYTETFTAEPGEAMLVIRNGEPGQKSNNDNRVTSGVISLNGVILFTHDDFKHQTYTLEVSITLLENNSLRIELESKPETYLSLEIIQTIPDPVYDLLASELQVDAGSCPESVDLSLQITNTGQDEIPSGVLVAFYNGNPDESGTLIGTTTTTELLPAGVEKVSLQWTSPTVEKAVLYARVDDDGTGAGAYEEVDETDNFVLADAILCRVVSGDSSLSGHIIDAVTGNLLGGVETLLHINDNGVPGAVVASVESNNDGVFSFPELAAGSYIISVSHPGYIYNQRLVSIGENSKLTNQDIVLSPLLAEDDIRIVLTWKDRPADLEAHLTGPNDSGCRYHCYYFNKTIPTAGLDLDDRNGYGPETISISDKAPGTYRYYVHDFTNRYANSRWLYYSGAKVTVYSGSREPLVFNVPNVYGNVWHVFNLDGETGEITPVHTMTRQSEPGRIDYPTILSNAPRYGYWGSTYTYQVKAVDPDDDTLTYSLQNAPAGMTIDPETGLIRWTPSGDQSGWFYNIVVKVDDGRCGEISQSFSVYVNSQPTVQFSVSPCSGYNPGGDITLTWSTTRVSTVLIDQGIGEVAASGSLTIPSPEVPTLYTLTAFNDAALVKRSTPAAPGASFYFSPRNITLGQSATLYWNSSCSTGRSIDHSIGTVPVSGFHVVTPTRSGYYYLTASNAGGTRRYRTYVYVSIPPDNFTISPVCNFTSGAPMTLSWHINNATSVNISPDVGQVETTGNRVVYPDAAGSYILTATVNGSTLTRSVSFPNFPTVNMSPRYSYGLDLGQSAALRWWSGCADTVTFNQGVGEVATSGTITVTPETLPQTYTVTATNERGSRSQSVRLYQRLPTVSLNPNYQYGMDLGDSVSLKWSTGFANSVSMNQGVGEIAVNGNLTVTPGSLPMTYTLTATNTAGSTSQSVTLYQLPPRGAITADPAILKVGNSTTLNWTSSHANTCTITPDIGPVGCNGSMTVTPSSPTYYYFNMAGPGGTYRRYVHVGFVSPVADLKASTLTIREGEAAQLTWVFANATNCSIDQGIGEVELGGETTVSPNVTTTYTMTAIGPGGTATDRVTINVIPINPKPSISLSLSDRIIMRGHSTVISWESNYADSVVIDQGIGIVSTDGSTSVSPEISTTYTATATGPGGTSTAKVAVTVMQPPPTLTLTANPVSIIAGESAILSWTGSDTETITFNQGIGSVELQGLLTVSPTTTTTYTATASGPGGTTTRSVTITVSYPEPTVTFSITPDTIEYGEAAVLNWNTTNTATVSIDQGVGPVDINGSYTVSPEVDTTYTITATGPGRTITAQAAVTVIPSPITLAITSPTDNAVLADRKVMVTGTVAHADGLETGVVVNGVIALVHAGQFVANHVPLDVGKNTITVKAVDVNGERVEKTITLTAKYSEQYVELFSSRESSLAPLETNILVDGNFTFVGSTRLTYSGPGTVDFLSIDEGSYSVRMTVPGMYIFTGTADDEFGNSYTASIGVLVLDKTILDTLLRNKWNKMKAGLAVNDINSAAGYFDSRSQERYRDIYTAIADKLPQLAADMQDIELIVAKDNYAQYRIRRNENLSGKEYAVTYYIYFTVGLDGLWRIYEY